MPGQSAAVPPPPPNPSDGDISQANSAVTAQLGAVGALINQVASANDQLSKLDDAVAVKREDVNKALVDLQNARSAADVANAAVTASKQALSFATTEIDKAQKKFDGYAAKTYTDGGAASSIASYLGSSNPDEILDRAQALEMLSRSQQAVLDGLQRARTEEANKDSAARKSKQDADAAAADAESKKGAAEQAIATAQAALQQEASRKTQIEAQRDSAQSQLDAARTNVAGLQGQREAFIGWDNQKQAEDAALAAAADVAKQIAMQAIQRVAANQAAKDRAAELAAGQRPHTQVEDDNSTDQSSDNDSSDGDSTDGDSSDSTDDSGTSSKTTKSSQPTMTGSAAIETVIDRGMSQLGVTYAWGGGDENGPTLGIRDGGVADSYGDYRKVGFDCSGLMVYAFAGIGISLPHYSGYQYTAGTQIPSSKMKRGDMIFYGANGSQHVALYLGNDQMLEAPESGSHVKVSPVRDDGMTPYVVRMVS
ncbi:NlpC/P60 family protein [Antrihabitans cavernicola]|uniref:NlpC/P60 family protein n=1 Tax=Antrihabitans cavernicola TaxID=2495913 RepID=A0A5A7SGA5_9NOCA|nr:NlpC/P60 family protein [Spelaeibacter cavernicola]KAA0023707.1 NlpC/P60 family protein [Spelaeibacter cavernicola]